MWNYSKRKFFEDNYYSLKDYAIRYQQDPSELKVQKTRTFKAPFENAVFDVVEFEWGMQAGGGIDIGKDWGEFQKAVFNLGCDYLWIYMARFIYGMSYWGIARLVCLPKQEVYERATLARKLMMDKLFEFNNQRSKK